MSGVKILLTHLCTRGNRLWFYRVSARFELARVRVIESTVLTRKMVFGKYQKTLEGLSATVCSLKTNSVAIWSDSTGFRQFSLFPFEGEMQICKITTN